MTQIAITGNPDADSLLDSDPFALLIGMLLDQQMPMERAFLGPYKIAQRMKTKTLEPFKIARMSEAKFAQICSTPPAVHRFPGSMAGRIQGTARVVVDTYDGDAAALWSDGASAKIVLERLAALPGFGEAKAKIFLALVAKQRGVKPRGWKAVTSPYGETGSTRSVADVTGAESLAAVRAFKQEAKRKAAAERQAG